MHGGAVHGSSRGPGLGSVFEVSLTAIDAPLSGAPPDERAPMAASARKVVIVDHHHDATTTTAELLSLLGHDVAVAHDGKSALSLIEAVRRDVAFLDIGLANMDGFELAQAVRGMGFAGKLVALTGYGEERDRLRAIDAGFNLHLTKPAQPGAARRRHPRRGARRQPAGNFSYLTPGAPAALPPSLHAAASP